MVAAVIEQKNLISEPTNVVVVQVIDTVLVQELTELLELDIGHIVKPVGKDWTAYASQSKFPAELLKSLLTETHLITGATGSIQELIPVST
jgi:hypothetical protein